VLETDPLVEQVLPRSHRAAPRSGWPPYWCQILHVPSLDTMQAPTGVSGKHS
jgi:hypothetical protein